MRTCIVILFALIVAIIVALINNASDWGLVSEMKSESPLINNIVGLLSALASVAIVGALVVAIGQIRSSADQLRHSRNHARAQAIYTALKDVRDMPLDADMGDRFNLYYALFEQKRLGVWDEDMWGPVEQDILVAFTNATIGEEARRYWESTKTNYTSEFQSCIERVLRSASA